MSNGDTIFALTTPMGRSGVAVLRVSGHVARSAAETICGSLPVARHAYLRTLRDPEDGAAIDQALVFRFERGESFTGEDVVEFQTHGSAAVVRRLLKSLGTMPGLRAADAGEFTRRALMNGCLDLAQVEGLGDLIEAETQAQLDQSLKVMQGALSVSAQLWRDKLLKINGLLEAAIDFDDEDLPDGFLGGCHDLMISTVADFRKELSGRRAAEMIRDGFEVAIVGPPNAGKSSLLNALAGRDVAITSSVAGTTRDVIEVRMDINGFAVTVLDTAGLRETNDAVESLGVDLARRRADAADLRVFLIERREDMAGLGVEPRGQDLVIYSKSDLLGHSGAMSVSTVTGNGISALIASVGAILEERVSGASTLIRQRHADALNAAADDISTAASMMAEGLGELDLVAELVRHATGQVDMLTGRIGVEDVLGEIFSRFCIGK